MKANIAVKLILCFAATLLLFSIMIGGVFITLFCNHTMEVHQDEMEQRAVSMSETLSELLDGSSSAATGSGAGMMSGKTGAIRAYMRFLDDIAMSDVWVVDENLQLLTSGRAGAQYQYADLPPNAEMVVKEVFEGKIVFSEGFSELIQTPTLTVGTPIQTNGVVIGALLLHSPVQGIDEATNKGIHILVISMVVALGLSGLVAMMLSFYLTKPLKKMKDTAIKLAEGDYTAKTEVAQQDEIGELAGAVDSLAERLDAASRESEQLDQLRRDFVANISHELRTPVTVIRGSLEAICDDVVTDQEQVKQYHQQMLKESLYLQRLVNDLLDLSRLQNTQFQMEQQEVNLCELLRDVVRSAGQLAKKKNMEIQLEMDDSVVQMMGDYGRLRQMFFIILDNAIKFSPENAVVSVRYKDQMISVQDHGVGIAKADLPYLFDRFYQVKSEQNKSGTGLGLAIAKEIADRHQIKVTVSSEEGAGTKFQFYLPSDA